MLYVMKWLVEKMCSGLQIVEKFMRVDFLWTQFWRLENTLLLSTFPGKTTSFPSHTECQRNIP